MPWECALADIQVNGTPAKACALFNVRKPQKTVFFWYFQHLHSFPRLAWFMQILLIKRPAGFKGSW
jgi:hypothetical protein